MNRSIVTIIIISGWWIECTSSLMLHFFQHLFLMKKSKHLKLHFKCVTSSVDSHDEKGKAMHNPLSECTQGPVQTDRPLRFHLDRTTDDKWVNFQRDNETSTWENPMRSGQLEFDRTACKKNGTLLNNARWMTCDWQYCYRQMHTHSSDRRCDTMWSTGTTWGQLQL